MPALNESLTLLVWCGDSVPILGGKILLECAPDWSLAIGRLNKLNDILDRRPRLINHLKGMESMDDKYGTTKAGTSLEVETEAFSNKFAPQGKFIGGARSTDLRNALSQDATILISCHGMVHASERLKMLSFDLKDGPFQISEFIPESILSSLVILSACHSGVYEMAEGDYPNRLPLWSRTSSLRCTYQLSPFANRSYMNVDGRHYSSV